MKAMILSAGFGTRLKQYTGDLPKALVPYRNIPMINYQIERLKKLGVTEIIVNAHHHSEKMVDYFSENNFGVDVHVIVEKEILGTGGGILNAEPFFNDDDFFLVLNVDIETDADLSGMIRYHRSKNPFATLAVQKRNTTRYLELDSEMRLIRRAEDDSNHKHLFAFNGIHIISKKIFSKGFEIKYEDILDLYFRVLAGGDEFISGYDAGNSSFKDLGKIENLIS